MSPRDDDLATLDRILLPCNEPELSTLEVTAFVEMRHRLRTSHLPLTERQRTWATEVDARLRPIDVRGIPPLSGRVPTIPVLAAPLPKRPPGSRP